MQDWLTAKQAAQIISQNSGKPVKPAYMQKLVMYGKLTPNRITNRLSLYSRAEVERIIVGARGGKHEQQRKTKTSEATINDA
jgi:hypothetical protein